MKAQIAAAEQRLAFVVKSTTAQLKRENLNSTSSSASSSSEKKEKSSPLALVTKNVTPTMVMYFLIFWMLWSVSSNLAALNDALTAQQQRPPQ